MAPGLPSSIDQEFHEERALQRIWRKAYQEPLIPVGCVLTCFALYQASRSMRQGDHHQTNRMFRARIYAQAFTILAMVGGSYYYAEERSKRKEFEGAVADRRAKEKQEAWIRELEHRQKEEQEIQEQMDAMRRTRQQQAAIERGSSGDVRSALEERERRRIGVLEAVLDARPRWR